MASLRRRLGGVTAPGRLRDRLLPLAIVLLALAVLLAGVWGPGAMRGLDQWGHIYRARYLAQQIEQDGPAAWFQAAWMPAWYLGDPFRTYYPPLTTLVLSPLTVLTSDDGLVYRLFLTLVLTGYALLCYRALTRLSGRWPAALGTVLALWAPYQLRTLFFEGNFPRALSLLALPLLALGTERLLAGPQRKVPLVGLLGLTWAWAILAHPQQAFMYAVGFGLYLVLRLFLEPDLPVRALGWWVGGLGLGALLTAPWSLPAYSGAEIPGVPFLPAEKVGLFVARVGDLLPSLDLSGGALVMGFGVLVLALLAAVARPEPRRTAYTFAGLLTLWLSLGERGVLFNLLPLHGQLLPERFINFSAFALAVAACGVLPLRRGARAARAVVVAGLLLIDITPGFSLWGNVPQPVDQARLAGLTGGEFAGRVALFTYPEPTSVETYYAGQGASLLQGWALENTPHHQALRRVLGAAAWGEEYLEARLSLWDVRTAVVRSGQDESGAPRALERMGFAPAEQRGPYQIWRSPIPSARVQWLPDQRMVAVGDGLSPMLGAFPFAQEIPARRFVEAGLPPLEQIAALALYRFESDALRLEAVEQALQDFLDQGGVVIVDLSGMESVVGRTIDFLGVQALRVGLSAPGRLIWDPALPALPDVLAIEPTGESGWSGATYEGLDVELGWVEREGVRHAVLGYRQVGAGRVWFVGMNLLYHAQLTGDARLPQALRARALEGTRIDTRLHLEPVRVEDYRETSRGLSFEAQAGRTGEVVVAYTHSPRWQVHLDGEPVELRAYEGLIAFELPQGAHRVDIRYRPYGTLWPVVGLALGLAGAGALAAAYVVERRRALLPAAPPRELEQGQPEYAPCANCGFRLAEVRPPTAITYPFTVVACPICGMQMDDEGFRQGRTLDRAGRQEALGAWLRRYDYDPEVVHIRWGFAFEEFFSGGDGEPSPGTAPPPAADDQPHSDR